MFGNAEQFGLDILHHVRAAGADRTDTGEIGGRATDLERRRGAALATVRQGVARFGDDHRLLVGLGLNVLSSPEQLTTSTSLARELPQDAPLLAQDWISFLERLIFEFSFSLQLSFEALNTTSRRALLSALNLHPLLTEPYTALDSEGNLSTPGRRISWTEL